MQLPDTAHGAPARERETGAIATFPRTVHGWGGGRGVPVRVVRPAGAEDLRRALVTHVSPPRGGRARGGVIPRGMGRSYGDAAQLDGGMVLDMTTLKGFQLEAQQGIVMAQAGTTIGELLHELVPAGWMVPVVPGTQHVTIGGAIASDIHGKNHGSVGTFGSHVRSLGLLTAAGEVLELERATPGGVLQATIGGMGLTGVILWAEVELRPVASSLLAVDTDRVETLDDALAVLSAPGGPHRVAWLDLLGSRYGRGVVTRAEHLGRDAAQPALASGATVRSRATVPRRWPRGILRTSTVRAFNELRYRRTPRRQRGHPEGLGTHMFPLDALDAWPRLYGPQGLLQYQLVVPYGQERVMHSAIEHLRRARVPCFLAVLKDFGAANEAPLSFPIAGWTLALDLPRAASGLERALDQLDELVAGAGGRVYLSKDIRLRPDALRAMYPRLAEWQAVRDRIDPDCRWRSDLGLRTQLVSPEGL